MADEEMRRRFRRIKADTGKIPDHLRKRYKLCECLSVTCPHCKNNYAPITRKPVCENVATETVKWSWGRGQRMSVCKECGDHYTAYPGSWVYEAATVDHDIHSILTGVPAMYLIEADDRLRAAERRYHESGTTEDHLKFLKLHVRAGNSIELIKLADTDEVVKAFDIKNFSYAGNSLAGLPAKIEKIIKQRRSPTTKKAKVTTLVIKWLQYIPGGYGFEAVCGVVLPSTRNRSMRHHSSSNSEVTAYDSDDTVFSAKFTWYSPEKMLRGGEPSLAHYEATTLSKMPSRTPHNSNKGSGVVIYSTVPSIPKGVKI